MARKSVYERFGQSQIAGSDQAARHHTVLQGETPWYIASVEYGTGQYESETWRQMLEANGIDDLDNIPTGTVLVIPSILPTST